MGAAQQDDRQKVEYVVKEVGSNLLSTKRNNPEKDLNDLAERGWRIVETIDEDGGATQFLILERDVDFTD